jgi:hypothetical protein
MALEEKQKNYLLRYTHEITDIEIFDIPTFQIIGIFAVM